MDIVFAWNSPGEQWKKFFSAELWSNTRFHIQFSWVFFSHSSICLFLVKPLSSLECNFSDSLKHYLEKNIRIFAYLFSIIRELVLLKLVEYFEILRIGTLRFLFCGRHTFTSFACIYRNQFYHLCPALYFSLNLKSVHGTNQNQPMCTHW